MFFSWLHPVNSFFLSIRWVVTLIMVLKSFVSFHRYTVKWLTVIKLMLSSATRQNKTTIICNYQFSLTVAKPTRQCLTWINNYCLVCSFCRFVASGDFCSCRGFFVCLFVCLFICCCLFWLFACLFFSFEFNVALRPQCLDKGLLGTVSPGQSPRLSHSSWALLFSCVLIARYYRHGWPGAGNQFPSFLRVFCLGE